MRKDHGATVIVTKPIGEIGCNNGNVLTMDVVYNHKVVRSFTSCACGHGCGGTDDYDNLQIAFKNWIWEEA
jgi:hypothetical protein